MKSGGVAKIFQQGGPKRGGEATERGEGVAGGCPPPPTRGRFVKMCVSKWNFCTLNIIIKGLGYDM